MYANHSRHHRHRAPGTVYQAWTGNRSYSTEPSAIPPAVPPAIPPAIPPPPVYGTSYTYAMICLAEKHPHVIISPLAGEHRGISSVKEEILGSVD